MCVTTCDTIVLAKATKSALYGGLNVCTRHGFGLTEIWFNKRDNLKKISYHVSNAATSNNVFVGLNFYANVYADFRFFQFLYIGYSVFCFCWVCGIMAIAIDRREKMNEQKINECKKNAE